MIRASSRSFNCYSLITAGYLRRYEYQRTLNVLQAAEIWRSASDSTSTSGVAAVQPITEEHPCKGSLRTLRRSWCRSTRTLLSCFLSNAVQRVRPFIYGPRQSTRAVIPTIISQLAGGLRQIKLGATHPTRDFHYVADIVSFCGAFTEWAGEVINLGSNFEISIEKPQK